MLILEDCDPKTPKTQKPDPNEASSKYSGTDQARDARLEERRKKGVYGAGPENGPGYEREDSRRAAVTAWSAPWTVRRTSELRTPRPACSTP